MRTILRTLTALAVAVLFTVVASVAAFLVLSAILLLVNAVS